MSVAEPGRIGVFGGSFDPPHVGHVRAVRYGIEKYALDRVLVIPTAHHPFEKENVASFEHRLRMCELAFGGISEVEISGIEAERSGPSRTYDTIRALRMRWPDAEFYLLVGSDLGSQTRQWYKWQEVEKLATPSWIPRAGSSFGRDAIPNINSTELRASLAAGQVDRTLLSPAVLAYIEQYGLYQGEP